MNTGKAKKINAGEKENLRRSILDISRQMLVQGGYEHLSMRKIAREVGCSATSIYHYFSGKDHLLHALIDEGFELLYADINGTEKHGEDIFAEIESMCRTYIDFGLGNPEYYEIMFLINTGGAGRYPVKYFRRARRPVSLLIDLLEKGYKAGIIETGQAGITAYVIWSALHGAVTAMLAGRLDSRIDRDKFRQSVIGYIMNSLTAGVNNRKSSIN